MGRSPKSEREHPDKPAGDGNASARKGPATKRPVGRPRKEWNPDTIYALGVTQATHEEIASACKVSKSTVERWGHDPDFDTALNAGKANGTLSLRRRLLTSDNPACMIFSAKNLLGWTDRQDITSAGAAFNPKSLDIFVHEADSE